MGLKAELLSSVSFLISCTIQIIRQKGGPSVSSHRVSARESARESPNFLSPGQELRTTEGGDLCDGSLSGGVGCRHFSK